MPPIKIISLVISFLFFIKVKSFAFDIVNPAEVTLYLLYTSSAQNYIEVGQLKQGAIKQYLEQKVIGKINEYFKNTDVHITLKLLFSENTSLPTSTDLNKDIKQFVGDEPYSTAAGKTEKARIHGKRDEIAADIVGLITYNDWHLNNLTQGIASGTIVDGKKILDAENAYFIVDVGRSNSYSIDLFPIVMAHEIGHILGLGHDKETALKDKITWNKKMDQQSISSSGHGYVIMDGTKRVAQTIMAYDDQNAPDYQELLNAAIPFYSNVNMTLQTVMDSDFGKVLGDLFLKLGTTSEPAIENYNYNADEATVLNANASTYTEFRVDKKLPIVKTLCPPRLPKLIVPDIATLCGKDGFLCGDCAAMDRAIRGNYTDDDYYFLQTRMSEFSTDFATLTGLGAADASDRPYGVFVGNAQERLYEYTIRPGDIPSEGNYELQIGYIVSSLGYSLKRLYELQGSYFSAEVYVDDNFYGPTIKAGYTNTFTETDGRTSIPSSISTNVWLKPTSKKLSIIITSGRLNTYSTNSNMAIVVIKNFDLSPAEKDISTEEDQIGKSDIHNINEIIGANAAGLPVFINGNTVTLPTIGSGKNPLIHSPEIYTPCNKCALRRHYDNNFLKYKIDWDDGSTSDWVQFDYIPFVHTYKNKGTYNIKVLQQSKSDVWIVALFGGWSSSMVTGPYTITINPPPKIDEPASISIPRRTVTLSEQNKRFFPENANLRFNATVNCNATGSTTPISKTATGNIKIDWGDGVISQTTVHLNNFPTTWNQYAHMYSGAAKYDIKIFYETKDIINVTSASGQATITCYNYEQITTNTIEMAEMSATYVTGLTPLKMVKIPGKNLLMSSTEITQGEYYSVTDRIPSRYQFLGTTTQNYPADDMTYYDAVVYCNYRSLIDGLQPVYSYDPPKEADYRNGEGNPGLEKLSVLNNLSVNLNKNGYRLPTKEEWEYAYLAGTSPNANNGYYWTTGNATDYAWYSANSTNGSNPVAKKISNKWGFYDMAGNVAEWLMNEPTNQNGSMGCAIGDAYCRSGGSFFDNLSELSYQSNLCASKRSHIRLLGFRVVRKAPDITPIINLLLGD